VVARTFELRPRAGVGAQLDDGYRGHLDWHARAGERWAWYLWEVLNGERAGLYVDGTFGHAWGDFDASVDPAGDGADGARNVEPFVTRPADHTWRLRPDLGGAPVDLEASRLVSRVEYRVRAGGDAAFAAALRRLRAAAGPRPYAVYELVSGGERPTYVVWTPAATWADLGQVAERTDDAVRALASAASWARAELWRFRPDLSLCRTAAAGCHSTLGRGDARPRGGGPTCARHSAAGRS
jgi:hypothetical protein